MKTSVLFKFFTLFICLLMAPHIYGQSEGVISEEVPTPSEVAPVKLDGNILFNIRGVSALPAIERANRISQRIKLIAENNNISIDSIKAIEEGDHISIVAGNVLILNIYAPDAFMEGVSLKLLSQSIEQKIRDSVYLYRHVRSKPVLIQHAIRALIVTIILVIILVFLLWLIKKMNLKFQNRIKKRIESVENISFSLIRSKQMWRIVHIMFGLLRTIVIISVVMIFIHYVFALFPWTNPVSKYILKLIIDPLKDFGNAILNYIPKLVFLVFIYMITKYVFKFINLLFVGIKEGNITIKGFNEELAVPTFKIIRIFVIIFAVIISYPYLPGSNSIAFKGVSVFFGVLLSLGSSSIIGNIVAGFSMIYRGAFKKGDLIKVNDQIGVVEEQKLMITRLRSFKNEDILIPNSVLLNSEIINYRAKATELGIILHTTVGIGYETSWRQVDAMLKLAASRTEGILKTPPPFVLKNSLKDFAVHYEVNGYCGDVTKIESIYSELHQHILDVFNENKVQIMTPFYVSDPETPKVVPKDQWDIP